MYFVWPAEPTEKLRYVERISGVDHRDLRQSKRCTGVGQANQKKMDGCRGGEGRDSRQDTASNMTRDCKGRVRE